MTEPIRLSRRGFLGATMAATAGLAVTGPEAFAGASAKKSPLVVHDWAYYQKDFTGFKAFFQKYGVPKYITFNTDQAELARAASGAITFDITHPCIAYTQDWAGAGLIGPIDTRKFTKKADNLIVFGKIKREQREQPMNRTCIHKAFQFQALRSRCS